MTRIGPISNLPASPSGSAKFGRYMLKRLLSAFFIASGTAWKIRYADAHGTNHQMLKVGAHGENRMESMRRIGRSLAYICHANMRIAAWSCSTFEIDRGNDLRAGTKNSLDRRIFLGTKKEKTKENGGTL